MMKTHPMFTPVVFTPTNTSQEYVNRILHVSFKQMHACDAWCNIVSVPNTHTVAQLPSVNRMKSWLHKHACFLWTLNTSKHIQKSKELKITTGIFVTVAYCVFHLASKSLVIMFLNNALNKVHVNIASERSWILTRCEVIYIWFMNNLLPCLSTLVQTRSEKRLRPSWKNDLHL